MQYHSRFDVHHIFILVLLVLMHIPFLFTHSFFCESKAKLFPLMYVKSIEDELSWAYLGGFSSSDPFQNDSLTIIKAEKCIKCDQVQWKSTHEIYTAPPESFSSLCLCV